MVIGRISGLCADYSQSTLNGRPYDRIYERILNGEDFRFNEMMKRGGIPCELGHPTDLDANGNPRTETDPTKVAVLLTKIEKGGPQKLIAEGDILDTPNGKIFKSLSESYQFGLSSRGSYEITDGIEEGPDGWNQDSYVFKGYDLVLLPANPGSVLSVTEGMDGNKKLVKIARESIDVNLLAKASQVSEDQVEEALDQLFKVDEDAKKSEEVPIRDMEEIDKLNPEEEVKDLSPEEETSQEELPEEEEENSVDTTLITNGEEVDKIKADLQKALDEISSLTELREKDGVELSNRNAEIEKLVSDNENLRSELEERIEESEQFVEKFQNLKDLAHKLVESYKAAKELFDSKEDNSDEVEKLKGELEEKDREIETAEESLSRERKISSNLRKELATAKESLISVYSMSYGVSTESIRASLGKNYSIKQIRPAVEALVQQTSKFSTGIPTFPFVGNKRSAANESLRAGDEVERELIDLIKKN